MSLWTIYYIGTRNVAVERIAAKSARTALALASAMVSTPIYYLKAKKVQA